MARPFLRGAAFPSRTGLRQAGTRRPHRDAPRAARLARRQSERLFKAPGRQCLRGVSGHALPQAAFRKPMQGAARRLPSLHQAAPGCTKVHQWSLCGGRSADGPGSLAGAFSQGIGFVSWQPSRQGGGCRLRRFPGKPGDGGNGEDESAQGSCRAFALAVALCSSGSWHGMSARRAGWRPAWRSAWTARGTVWRPAGPFAGAQGRSRTSAGSRAKPMPCAAGETPALGWRARRDEQPARRASALEASRGRFGLHAGQGSHAW